MVIYFLKNFKVTKFVMKMCKLFCCKKCITFQFINLKKEHKIQYTSHFVFTKIKKKNIVRGD